MKKIRDSLPAQPTFPYNASADEIEKICKDYTSFVTFFKEETMKLHNDYDAERFYPDEVLPYSKKDSIFEKMENGNQCMKIKRFGGTRYFYPKGDFADEKNWKDDTFFILQGRTFIANNFEHYRDCEQYIIDHAPDKQGTKRAVESIKKY